MLLAARRFVAFAIVPLVLFLSMGLNPTDASAVTAYYLSPTGNDANPGTEAAPWRTFTAALPKLRAGDTLLVRGGTYVENAILSGSSTLAKGTAASRITVQAYPGENPVIQGIVHLSSADYWTIDNIDVTWNPANSDTTQHMVRFYKGTGWELKNSELWGAKSYAALLVNGGSTNFWIHHNYIHDTYPSNGTSQDHAIYVSDANTGIVEYNLLVNAPNGRGIKLGHPNGGYGTPAFITVRYNTMVGNGSANVSASYDTHNNQIDRNVFVTAGAGYANVGTYHLSGANNVASNNIGWDAKGVLKADPMLVDGGGNLYADPMLDASYRPQNPALYSNGTLLYGHLAGSSPVATSPVAPVVVVDAELVAVSAPASVTQGSPATIAVAVKNNGTASATIPVTLAETPGGFSQSQTVTVDAGATATVSFSWATTTATATGAHTFTATTALADDSNTGNNSQSATTTVQAPASSSMSVINISLSAKKQRNQYALTSSVAINSAGAAVAGAVVTIDLVSPNGSKTVMTATTNTSGSATFNRSVTAKGTYTIKVTNVTKTGMTYNAAGNAVSSKSLTI